jgi:hypothetical protein
LASDLNAVEFGQTDIEQDQVWLQFPALLDGFQSIRSFADDLTCGIFFQKQIKETAPGFEIVHHENTYGWYQQKPSTQLIVRDQRPPGGGAEQLIKNEEKDPAGRCPRASF